MVNQKLKELKAAASRPADQGPRVCQQLRTWDPLGSPSSAGSPASNQACFYQDQSFSSLDYTHANSELSSLLVYRKVIAQVTFSHSSSSRDSDRSGSRRVPVPGLTFAVFVPLSWATATASLEATQATPSLCA